MATGIAATQLIQYYFYKQSTIISGTPGCPCFAIVSIADAGNGQLLITTTDTSSLVVATGITITGTPSYDGNYTIISLTPTTFNISGTFGVSEIGTWELASSITGAEAGDHLDAGLLFFYDQDDKITLQDTFADRDLTIPNPNPIILDGLGSTPVFYLQNKPYYVEIYDKFNNLVQTLDNYLPSGEEDTPGTQVPLENLLPNYGFDTRINENIYDETSINSNGETAVSAGWFWEVATTETSAANTYRYNALGAAGLPGNPKNEIILRSTNNTSGQTVNRLYVVLGDYNAFQGVDLLFTLTTRLLSGTTMTLPIELQRTENGILQTPIPVGTIPITVVQTATPIVFTVPPLTTSNYVNNDTLRLLVNLPFNEDFEHSLTASWCQISPNNVITDLSISETGGATDTGKEFFGRSFRDFQDDEQYKFRGLPVVIGEGQAEIMPLTGTILQANPGITAQYNDIAVSMIEKGDPQPGVELVRDEVRGFTQTNRLIDYLRAHNITQSRFTFTASTGGTNVVTVGLGIGAPENSSWQTSAAPRITVAKPTDELIYKLNAIALGAGEIRFTFVDNFIAFTRAFNPVYSGGGGDLFDEIASRDNVIVNWLGRYDFYNTGSNKNLFYNDTRWTVVSNGSVSTPAVVNYSFPDAHTQAFIFDKRWELSPDVNLGVANTAYHPTYFGYAQSATVREVSDPGTQDTGAPLGFLAYNDTGTNPNPQPLNPPRSIRFTIDGVTSTAPTGTLSTANVPITLNDTKERVARRISETINTSFEHHITIVSTPNNADIVEISNVGTDFNLIFWDTTLPKPANPSTIRKPIYVQFTGADTTIQIATATANSIESGVAGVPRAADLGLDMPEVGISYFMVL